MDKKVVAQLNRVRHSPYKMRVVARQVKRMDLGKARTYLAVSPKKAARYIRKVLESALANATNNYGYKESDLVIDEIQVGEGQVVKSPIYRARGRMDIARGRLSKVRVVLKVLTK